MSSEYDRSTQTPEQVADEVLHALDRGKYFVVSGKKQVDGEAIGARAEYGYYKNVRESIS